MTRLEPDHDQLNQFVRALFRYADPGTYISLRGFNQFRRDVPPEVIRPVKINGDLASVVQAAFNAASECANAGHPVVFAPPVCTFLDGDRARGIDLANGVALSVEIDEGNTTQARARLEGLLGPCTIVMASGGVWADPATGEVHPKLHLHWRLNEPTRDADDHARLRMARDIAAQLAGGDPTGKPVVHPLRWPGSWNQKDKPRLAKILTLNDQAEIDLNDAIEALTDAQEAAGMAVAAIPRSSDPTAPIALVSAAMAMIPNPGKEVHYDDWIKLGYAAHRATGGGENGYKLWNDWSEKSEKYDPNEQAAAWGRINRAILAADVPVKAGAGTIFFLAARAGWVRPEPQIPEPPEETDDPGYWESIYTQAQEALDPPHPTPHEPPIIDQDGFPATPISADELDNIPPRHRVYGHFLFRKYLSAVGAPGGSGKTAYAFALALAIACGVDLLGEGVYDPGPVWIYNLEDPRQELLRRMKAAMIGHDLTWQDIEGKIFMDSGRDRPLVIARALSDGTIIAWPHVADLIAEIKARNIRVLIVDPFVRSHRVEENVNDQVDYVAALWSTIADAADCSILLVHHFKKGGISGDAAAFRGASALIDASRAAVTLATMSQDEAKGYGIEDKDRWRYIRADNAKLNLAPPPDAATWLELQGIDLGNGTDQHDADQVQTVTRWVPPSAFDGIPTPTVIRILDDLEAGPGNGEQYYLTGGVSDRWAGHVIMRHTSKNEAQAKKILAAWKASGLVAHSRYHSPEKRKEVAGITVNMSLVSEMGH